MNIRRKILEWVNGELAKDYEHELKMIENNYAFDNASKERYIHHLESSLDNAEKHADALFEEKQKLELEIERLHQVVKALKGLGEDFGAKTEGKKLKI